MTAFVHPRYQPTRRFAFVESLPTFSRDALERRRELGVAHAVADAERRAVWPVDAARDGISRQACRVALDHLGEHLIERETILRELNCRGHDDGARQLPVLLVCLQQPGHVAGHTDDPERRGRVGPHGAHAPERRDGLRRIEVDELRAALALKPDQHRAATADP